MLRIILALGILSVSGAIFIAWFCAVNADEKKERENDSQSEAYNLLETNLEVDLKNAWEKSGLADKAPNQLVDGTVDLVAAIRQAGHIRSAKALPHLILALNVVAPAKRLRPGGTAGERRPLWDLYPARSALVRIGTPALNELVSQYTGAKKPKPDSLRDYALLQIVAAIASPEGGVRQFEKATKDAEKEADKKSLENALERFKKLRSVPIFVQDPSYQLFTGNVFEALGGKEIAPEDSPKAESSKPKASPDK